MEIAAAGADEFKMIWKVIEPAVRAGDNLALPVDMNEAAAARWWTANPHTYVARDAGRCVGAYFFRANQPGPDAHVANAGYIVAADARGRGIAQAMCRHSLEEARRAGFRAMQFNIVVSVNEPAVRAWKACGFTIVGTLPGAFNHPAAGFVDAYVMHRML